MELHVQAGVAEHVMVMLESSSAEVRSVAAACLGDLAAAHPPLQLYLTQVSPYSPTFGPAIMWLPNIGVCDAACI